MESSRFKRRRLLQTYVSSKLPDLLVKFESLNDDTLTTVLEFVGDKSYRSFGSVNKHCQEIYLLSGMTKETFLFGYAPLSIIIDRYERDGEVVCDLSERVGKGIVSYGRLDVLDWALRQRKIDLLSEICNVATIEGNLEILDEVWNHTINENVDYKRTIFGYVDVYAADVGKLEVLKWLEDKGKDINKTQCAEIATRYGQLHILQWLKEERRFELFGELYNEAINGNHLHIMKWLREQNVPWHKYTFPFATEKGDLEVLQWLHDEGCPWANNDYYRVDEVDLKHEVIDWCRLKGYGNRIEYY